MTEQEQKLREAANDYAKHASINPSDKEGISDDYFNGAKSEAAREYWQSQHTKEVDVPSDRDIALHWKRKNCSGHYLEGLLDGSQWMRDELKPHLQPKQESDAVDIADFSLWLMQNFVQIWDRERTRYSYVDRRNTVYINGSEYHYAKVCKEYGISIQQVMTEFKQSKTNSDEYKK